MQVTEELLWLCKAPPQKMHSARLPLCVGVHLYTKHFWVSGEKLFFILLLYSRVTRAASCEIMGAALLYYLWKSWPWKIPFSFKYFAREFRTSRLLALHMGAVSKDFGPSPLKR